MEPRGAPERANGGWRPKLAPQPSALWLVSLVACAPPNARAQERVAGWGLQDFDSGWLAEPFVQIAAGGNHSLALRSDGALLAWDNDLFGQSTVPALPAGFAWTQIASAHERSVALLGPPCSAPSVYCSAKPNSFGCVPAISSAGTPSASLLQPFRIKAKLVLNNESGLLFYGQQPLGAPFQGGTRCVRPPIRRTGLHSSGGNPPPNDCSEQYSFDFNDYLRSGADPNLVAGIGVFAQYWSRDPAHPHTTGLTDAVGFTIRP